MSPIDLPFPTARGDAYGHARMPAPAGAEETRRIDRIPYGRFRNVYPYITEACQLRCGSCYMGARLERALKMPFEQIEANLPEPVVPDPRVVGVDEYATRKGRFHGTVPVDVETRRPIDMLPDREAASPTAWPTERPGVEVVCRDRAPPSQRGPPSGSKPLRPNARKSTPSPATSDPSRECSPNAEANNSRTGSTQSAKTTFPPSPQASTATATPSSPGSPCPGTPASSKDTSTASLCGI
ncbi:hypothetical protein [Embleya sp. AB8]|uniref:hypothetical protein n=1 Tax=Embleya sp. AB8 TaxID=3156304 RepID=UPI003C735B77